MTDPRESLAGPFASIDLSLLVIGVLVVAAGWMSTMPVLVYAGACLFLVGSSTFVVLGGLGTFTGEAIGGEDEIEEDTGWLIGKLENILVLVLVLGGEWTALSIVFAAKSFVRREDISSGNTTYYLAGTLLNFTYSVVIGMGTWWLAGTL